MIYSSTLLISWYQLDALSNVDRFDLNQIIDVLYNIATLNGIKLFVDMKSKWERYEKDIFFIFSFEYLYL